MIRQIGFQSFFSLNA